MYSLLDVPFTYLQYWKQVLFNARFFCIHSNTSGSLQPCICLMSALYADKCWCATPQSTFTNNTTALFYSQRVFPYFPADSACTVYLIFQNDLISLQEEGSMVCTFLLRNIFVSPRCHKNKVQKLWAYVRNHTLLISYTRPYFC